MNEQPAQGAGAPVRKPDPRSRQQIFDDAIAAGREDARLNPPPERPWRELPLVDRLEVVGVGLVVLVMLVAVCNPPT